jgi:hypothetical protein
LADLRAQLESLRTEADRRLADQERLSDADKTRREARDRLEAFRKRRDDALFR